MTDKPPERVYTMVEGAAKLGIGRRALQDLIKTHPHYALNGRRKLFDDADLAALWNAMHQHGPRQRAVEIQRTAFSGLDVSEKLRRLTVRRRRR